LSEGQKMTKDEQVSRARNGQKFGESLHEAHHNCVKKIHDSFQFLSGVL
jgi:hypothetical protein